MKEDVPVKKDRQAPMVIYAALLEEILEKLDDEITAKETSKEVSRKGNCFQVASCDIGEV